MTPHFFDQTQFLNHANQVLAHDPSLSGARNEGLVAAHRQSNKEKLVMQTWSDTIMKVGGKGLAYTGILMTASILSCPPVVLAGMGACAIGSLISTLRASAPSKKRLAM